MKNLLAELIEGMAVGILMAILLIVIGVEADVWQFAAITAGAIIFTSIASAIRKAVVKGEFLYNYEWAFQYGENSIIVKASKDEELYINGKLADKKTGISLKAVELNGVLDSGEKVTAIIGGEKIGKAITSDTYLRCELQINGKPLAGQMNR